MSELQNASYTVIDDPTWIHIWKRPDGTQIKTPKEIVNELNALLALVEKAETVLSNRNVLLGQVHLALDAANVETHHPYRGCGERKPMTLAERIELLAKSRDEWRHIARRQTDEVREELRILEDRLNATHPDPSRLEIAKDILCAWEGVDCVVRNPCIEALRLADELIAAAKEAQP